MSTETKMSSKSEQFMRLHRMHRIPTDVNTINVKCQCLFHLPLPHMRSMIETCLHLVNDVIKIKFFVFCKTRNIVHFSPYTFISQNHFVVQNHKTLVNFIFI